jgi:FAD:protein FMN transferase
MKVVLILLTTLLVWGSQRTQAHMGTLISVNVADDRVSDDVFLLFADLDNRLSTYKSDSEISRLNRNLDLNVSEVTRNVLVRSMEMYRISDGAFDITVGSFTHGAYRFGYESEHLPSKSELKKAEHFVGSNRIDIEDASVRILPGTVIDLGGIGKGYAVDLAMETLIKKGVDRAVIAASGDIGCLGECAIEIQDPFHPKGHIATLFSTLNRFAVSTSGNYERYIKNKTHNHLIDPKTGQSQQRYASITLIDTQDNTRLDALATAVSIMEEQKAIEMLKKLNIAYVLIRTDGTILKSMMPLGVRISL